jgi:exosortase E/protease (VPEID-CTERM system)
MSTTPLARSSELLPYVRWAGLVALLTAEILTISIRFDTQVIRDDWPCTWLVVHTGQAVRSSFAIALATLLIVGRSWYSELKREGERLKFSARSFAAIAGNLTAFLGFYGLSAVILEHSAPPFPLNWVMLVAWWIAGLAIPAFWGWALLPGDLWVSLVRQGAGGLAAGSALGASCFAIGRLARDQWQPLSRATLWLVRDLLSFVFPDIIYLPEESIVGTASFQAKIMPDCSGYEGMGLIAVLLSVALWLFRRDLRFPRAFALLPLGIALMWVANAVRLASLIALGTWGYPKIAYQGFHSLAGWLLFLLIGLGLIACARRLPFFSTIQTDAWRRPPTLDSAYLIPAMAIIATAMVTSAFSPGFDGYYPARVIAVMVAFLIYRRSYTELHLKWSWEALATGCGVFVLWMVMERYGATASSGTSIRSGLASLPPGWATAWLIFRVVGSVLMVPLAEELAFRGYLTRRLIAADFQSIPPGRMTWWSFLGSSLLFGMLHGRWFAGTLAGMAYALAYRRRGELADAVLAHGVTNGLIAITVLTTGSWSLWS